MRRRQQKMLTSSRDVPTENETEHDPLASVDWSKIPMHKRFTPTNIGRYMDSIKNKSRDNLSFSQIALLTFGTPVRQKYAQYASGFDATKKKLAAATNRKHGIGKEYASETGQVGRYSGLSTAQQQELSRLRRAWEWTKGLVTDPLAPRQGEMYFVARGREKLREYHEWVVHNDSSIRKKLRAWKETLLIRGIVLLVATILMVGIWFVFTRVAVLEPMTQDQLDRQTESTAALYNDIQAEQVLGGQWRDPPLKLTDGVLAIMKRHSKFPCIWCNYTVVDKGQWTSIPQPKEFLKLDPYLRTYAKSVPMPTDRITSLDDRIMPTENITLKEVIADIKTTIAHENYLCAAASVSGINVQLWLEPGDTGAFRAYANPRNIVARDSISSPVSEVLTDGTTHVMRRYHKIDVDVLELHKSGETYTWAHARKSYDEPYSWCIQNIYNQMHGYGYPQTVEMEKVQAEKITRDYKLDSYWPFVYNNTQYIKFL